MDLETRDKLIADMLGRLSEVFQPVKRMGKKMGCCLSVASFFVRMI